MRISISSISLGNLRQVSLELAGRSNFRILNLNDREKKKQETSKVLCRLRSLKSRDIRQHSENDPETRTTQYISGVRAVLDRVRGLISW